MAKIDRHTGNLIPFAKNASGVERKIFGGTIESDILDDNLTALFGEGWADVTNPTLWPKLRDFNSTMFTATQLIAYMIQRGIPEYHPQQEYFEGSMCSSGGKIYVSLTDNNTGELLTDPLFWHDLHELDDDIVTTLKVLNKAITLAKLADSTPSTLLGFDVSGVASTYELPLGVGQTWKTTNYTTNTDHYNTSGRAIYVIIGGALDSAGGVSYSIDGEVMFNEAAVGFIVPNGSYFRFPSVHDQIELS